MLVWEKLCLLENPYCRFHKGRYHLNEYMMQCRQRISQDGEETLHVPLFLTMTGQKSSLV